MTDIPPEVRKEMMHNLYNTQTTLERLVQMKMDVSILMNTEVSPELKESYTKKIKIWNQIVDAEIETVLRTALQAPKSSIEKTPEKVTVKDYIKLITQPNLFIDYIRIYEVYVISTEDNPIEEVELESGEKLTIKLPKYQNIFNLYMYPYDDYTHIIESSSKKQVIQIYNRSPDNELREIYIRDHKCSKWHEIFPPIKYPLTLTCPQCKRLLLFTRIKKQKVNNQQQIHSQLFNIFDNGIANQTAIPSLSQ